MEAVPAQGFGQVIAHRRGHNHLVGLGHQLSQALPAPGIEFGKNIVEEKDGFAIFAQLFPAGQPERQCVTPAFPVAGIAFSRQGS